MPKNNPVRGQYTLVGSDLVKAGIRPVNGVIAFYRENGPTQTSPIFSMDPASERWLTARAVSSACAKAGIPIDLNAVPAATVMPFLAQDKKAKVRTTEDHIVHMLGGESPEHRAYAQDQVAQLEVTYGVTPAVAKVA